MIIRCKELQRITGKSERQCYRDLKKIKSGRKKLVTNEDVENFYGLSEREIENALKNKQSK